VKSSSMKTRWAVRFALLPLLFLSLLSLPAKGQAARVSFTLNQATVEEALRAVFQHGGGYRLPPGTAGGAVTAVVQDVPLETALRLVLRQAVPPLAFRVEGGTYVIYAPERLPPSPVTTRGAASPSGSAPAEFRLAGDWEIWVTPTPGAPPVTLRVSPPVPVTVDTEPHASLPLSDPTRLTFEGILLQVGIPDQLDPASVVVSSGLGDAARVYRLAVDYDLNSEWGVLSRTATGGIREGQPVYVSYRYTPLRLDSVVQTASGSIVLRGGVPHSATPVPRRLGPGERRLGNIWLTNKTSRLSSENLFPILEDTYPELPKERPSTAERLLPKTLRKLRSGEPLRILAWGDSVTEGSYFPNWERLRWQQQFLSRLQERFPRARISMHTEAWGAHASEHYLAEPTGSRRNFAEKVLALKPDLVVSEFVNDCHLNARLVDAQYGRILAEFRGIGAEWIILAPHYVRLRDMGFKNERQVDLDPRYHVSALRQFGPRNGVPVADAPRRYGRLWRQGLPYTSLMTNGHNHPDARGMRIFADALMELFP
jgi:hypothetical protein